MFRIGGLQRRTNARLASAMGGGGGAFFGGSSSGGGSGAMGMGRGGNVTRYNPVYDDLSEGSIIEYFLPVDPRRLHRIWRRIYLQDSIAGPAVDMIGELPWSNWEITGIQDRTVQHLYEDCYNAIGAVSLMPELTKEFLVMGKYIAHLLYDDSKGYFTRCIVQDPDYCKIEAAAVAGFPPKIDLIPTPAMKAWSVSQDPRDIESRSQLGDYADFIQSGQMIPLDPSNTIYVCRKTAPYDDIGASIFTRIIMFVAYEKALVNATVAAAKRRAGKIRHLVAGIDGAEGWEPSAEELDAYANLFMRADEDPVGAIVVTRTGVAVNEVGGNSPQDMVKISDEWGFISTGKMNALGISEAFLSGEATYSSLEQLMSVFLEKIKALRAAQTVWFLDEVAKRLARKNGFIKRTQAELKHGVYVKKAAWELDDSELILPTFSYAKNLRPVADKDYMEVVEKLQEMGMPVTLRTWAAVAGFDLNEELEQLDEDVKLRHVIAKYKEQAEGTGDAGDAGGEDTGGGDEEGDLKDILGDEGSPLRASSFLDPMLDKVRSLPIWKLGSFLGVSKDHALDTVRKLGPMMNGKDQLELDRFKVATLVETGNPRRNDVMTYILIRCGILHGKKISKDTAEDIAKELCGLHVPNLVDELAYVQACTYANARHQPQAKRDAKILQFKSKTPIAPLQNSKLLYTGVATEPEIKGV